MSPIGLAPALLPPLSWWLGWRCRRAMQAIEKAAKASGTTFIDFSTSSFSARLRRTPGRYFAADGLHPSTTAYRECFEVLCRVPAVARLVGQRNKPAPLRE